MTTLRRQMKNMVKNYSEAEVKVREATSNDPWGPSSTLMSEISDLTYNIVALGEIMRMIWKRLNDHGKNWRHVYKSLVLLDYLIKNGNEKVAQQCKEHIVAIQTLKDFQYMEEQKDQGASVREKAKQLVNLLRDDERLKAERAKAFKARERFAQNAMGISSDNKMVFASKGVAGSTRPNSSYVDPYGGAGAAASGASSLTPELEAVRPSDQTEEELQIKLAIMLSQQEHEEEVQRKRADEAKLAIALEQSKHEGQPNELVDISDDPWADQSSSNSNSMQHNDPFAPIGGATSFESNTDPWLPSQATASSLSHSASSSKQHQNSHNDPWKANGTTNPWSDSSSSANNQQDEFDLFSSNRKTSIPTAETTSKQQVDDPFGDFFGGGGQTSSKPVSTNPWNDSSTTETKPTVIDPFASTTIDPFDEQKHAAVIKSTTAKPAPNPTRKTPESFLGENSSLVNLENLIPSSSNTTATSTGQQRPKSTNPFGGGTSVPTTTSSNMTTSSSHGQLNNPFAMQQALNRPTINQLQQQSMFPSFGTNVTTPVTAAPTLLQPSLTGGGLAQPLIVAPAQIQPIQSSFMQTGTTSTTATSNTPNLFPQLSTFNPLIVAAPPFGGIGTPLGNNPPSTTLLSTNSTASSTAASTNPFLMM